MAHGYLTDPFGLNYGMHDYQTCNCTNIPLKTCLQASVNLLKVCKTLGHYPGMYTECKQCRNL